MNGENFFYLIKISKITIFGRLVLVQKAEKKKSQKFRFAKITYL